ncbi:MAG: CocE/NonD family hydrolase [Planctomycetota bacterium]
MPKLIRKALFWAAVLYALSLPFSFILGGALFARPVKDPVSIANLADALDPAWDRTFLSGLREVAIQLRPGVSLRATVFGGDSYATVIVLHESRKNRLSGLPAAYALWSAGFDVLLVDRRAHGSSDGDMLPLFGGEEQDLTMVVNELISSDWSGTSRIGMFGMGDAGTSCLIAAAADPRIDAVVAQNPALRADDFVATRLRSWFLLPEPLLVAQTYLAVTGMCVLANVDRAQLDASSQIAGLRTPTLLLLDTTEGRREPTSDVFRTIPSGVASLQEDSDVLSLYGSMVEFFDRHL